MLPQSAVSAASPGIPRIPSWLSRTADTGIPSQDKHCAGQHRLVR